MTVPQQSNIGSPLNKGVSWFDPDTGCTIVVSTPSVDPALWASFVDGAVRSYHTYGIETALDMDLLLDEANTQLFHAAVNDSGKVVGGMRARGPLESPEESHALVEWEGRPGLRRVRKMLSDRLPFGVVEMKTTWMSDDPGRSRSLSNTCPRPRGSAQALTGVCRGPAASAGGLPRADRYVAQRVPGARASLHRRDRDVGAESAQASWYR